MNDSALAGTAQPPDKNISRDILAEQVKLAFSQINFGLLATVLCAVAYLIVAWEAVSHTGLITWFAALTALTFIRHLSSRIFLRKKPGAEEASRWSAIFSSGCFLSGFFWGMAGIFLFPENFIGHQVFLILLVAGLSAGTVSAYPAIKWASPLFILPSIGILTVKIFSISGDIYQAMGAVMVLYIFAMLVSAQNMHKSVLDSLNLRFENVDLIAEMEKANKKFRQLTKATFEGILVHDKGKILFTNDILPEMFGYKAEEMLGINALDFVAPEQRDFVKEKILSGYEEPYETVGIKKDGLRVPIEIHGKPVPYENRIVRMAAIRDLTKRKESEIALRDSEERYRDLFENANDFYYTTDLEGKFTSFNSATLTALGYKLDELLGEHYGKIVPPELIEKAGEMTRRKLDGQEQTRYELELIGKDGHRIPIELSSKLIIRDGAPVGIQGAARDITKRKKAEKELHDQLQFQQTLLETIPNPVFYKNAQGRYTGCNAGFEKLMGKHKKEFIGKTVYEIAPKELADIYFKKDMELFDNPGVQIYETEVDGADGRLNVIFYKATFNSADGSLGGLIGVMVDITERKKAEDSLKILKNALDQTSEMVVITDSKGVVEYVNQAMEKITGYSSKEIIGGNPRVFKSGKHEDEFYKNMWDTIKAGNIWSDQIINKTKSGELAEEEMTISPIKDNEDNITHFVAIKRDISERKRSEEKLKKAKEEAEEATKLKDKFVSLVAHDLKAPFNSILGFLALLSDEKAGSLTPQQKEIVNRAFTGGEKLVQMIDDMLDLSLLQSGKLTLQRFSFFAGGIIDGVIEEIGNLADSKNIKIEIEVSKGTEVYADIKLFHGVIMNLVSNAIKFCVKGGLIRIFISNDEDTTIAVSDTGVGMESHMLNDIFRHETKTTTKGTAGEEGTGIGLPFCYYVMKAHGGSIRVESKEGEGSVFYAYFPPEKS